MDRGAFLDLLARAVKDQNITEQEASALLKRFDAGELEVGDDSVPLPLSEAVRPADSSDIERAIVALLAIGSLSLLHRRVRQVRETLQDTFKVRAATLAKRYSESGNVRAWQESFREAVFAHIIQQRAVGSGRIPIVRDVAESTLKQSAYIARFADEVALKALAGEPPSYFQMVARSALYAGAARAEGFRAEAEDMPDGTVAEYVAVDDSGTCGRCLDAEGVYSLNEPFPVPGDVCEGRGNCRCRVEYRSAA